MNLSDHKTKWTIFTVALVITAAELFYLFFYKQQAPGSKNIFHGGSATLVKAIGLPKVPDEKIASQSGDPAKEIIIEALEEKRNFVPFNNFLETVMNRSNDCVRSKKCFKLDNQAKKAWKNDIDKDFPIPISGPFVVKMQMSGKNGPSGISLSGRLSKNDKIWWQGIKSIFFGIGKNGKRLYIDAKSNDPNSVVLFDKTFDNTIEGIYIVFDKKGATFLVTDLKYNKIAFVNINRVTKNRFPFGLFPDGLLYIGYAVAPSSDLHIDDLSIL